MLKRSLLLLAFSTLFSILFAAESQANTNPSVVWTSTNNSTVAGKVSFKATATPATTGTASIKKWCLTVNGEEATNQYAASFTTQDANEGSYYSSFSGGCWSGNWDIRKITLSYDTTKWENKAYTLVVKVTDSSDRESTAATLTFTTANTNPTIAWTSTNNSTVAGKVSFKATATPAATGTATIKKWCLTINGEEATNQSAASFIRQDGAEGSYWDTFSNGCWSGPWDIRKITLSYDTTKNENKAYTLVVKVTDSSDRESTAATLTFITANPGPVLTTPNLNITTAGNPVLVYTATPKADLPIANWCISTSIPNLQTLITFKDLQGKIVNASDVKNTGDCWATKEASLEVQVETSELKNSIFKVFVTVSNQYGHNSNRLEVTVDLKDPGLKLSLPSSGKLVAPTALPSVTIDQQSGQREVSEITWFIDGKRFNSGDDLSESLDADKSELPDGSHLIRVEVKDSAGNTYQSESNYLVEWPKMVLSLTNSKTIDPADEAIEIIVNSNPGDRKIDSVIWRVDGKIVNSYEQDSLSTEYESLPGGNRKITATIKDEYGDTYVVERTYAIKWSPSLKLVGLDGYFYYSPASPKVTVKAYLGGGSWSGKHAATASYKNSNGKLVKQSFTISNGTGTVVLQTLKVTTDIRIDVAAGSTNNAASVSGEIELRKKPPAPVYTNIYLTLPKIVYWPKSFNVNVRVTGKGYYSCRLNFQNYYVDFGVSAGGTTTVNVQPTLGVNMAQKLYGSCTGTGNAGTTYFDDWIIVSLQR